MSTLPASPGVRLTASTLSQLPATPSECTPMVHAPPLTGVDSTICTHHSGPVRGNVMVRCGPPQSRRNRYAAVWSPLVRTDARSV
ncbi:hypothetical protein ACFQX7_07605 [Luedemannella flava]